MDPSAELKLCPGLPINPQLYLISNKLMNNYYLILKDKHGKDSSIYLKYNIIDLEFYDFSPDLDDPYGCHWHNGFNLIPGSFYISNKSDHRIGLIISIGVNQLFLICALKQHIAQTYQYIMGSLQIHKLFEHLEAKKAYDLFGVNNDMIKLIRKEYPTSHDVWNSSRVNLHFSGKDELIDSELRYIYTNFRYTINPHNVKRENTFLILMFHLINKNNKTIAEIMKLPIDVVNKVTDIYRAAIKKQSNFEIFMDKTPSIKKKILNYHALKENMITIDVNRL